MRRPKSTITLKITEIYKIKQKITITKSTTIKNYNIKNYNLNYYSKKKEIKRLADRV